jgi:hypothetical protein
MPRSTREGHPTVYFDQTLEAAPVEEQQSTPVIPEERHVFELVGFERSEPDQWRKDGGVKWSYRVFEADGRTPFVFQDEQYVFFRTTGLTRDGKPNFNIGTYANEWASALLGRDLGTDAKFSVSELRGKRMSAMVVWEPQRSDPKKKTIKLASLRHVPVEPLTSPVATPEPAPVGVAPDASIDEIDRRTALVKFEKKLARAKKRGLPSLSTFQGAYDEMLVSKSSAGQIDAISESLDDALDKMDD